MFAANDLCKIATNKQIRALRLPAGRAQTKKLHAANLLRNDISIFDDKFRTN